MRLALVVEYDGTAYHGFQHQVNALSIQEEIEEAIKRITGERLRVKGAGRTDAGVHAMGQVVTFDTESSHPPSTVVSALNAHLPESIGVRAAYRVRGDFDPRRNAVGRRYRYTIVNAPTPSPLLKRTAHHVKQCLNVQMMNEASKQFVGLHDFARFATTQDQPERSTYRRIYETAVTKEGDIVTFDIRGSSFLPRQVRRMVGALVDVGRGEVSTNELAIMIDGGETDKVTRSLPPNGLCLMAVEYDDFPPDDGGNDGK